MKLTKSKHLIFSLIIFSYISQTLLIPCNRENNCLEGFKFQLYSVGSTQENKSGIESFDYKNIYLYTNKIVIMRSNFPDTNEQESNQNIPLGPNNNAILNTIFLQNIKLECGKGHDRLCFVHDYPRPQKIAKAIEFINKTDKNGDVHTCLVIPSDSHQNKNIVNTVIICPGTAGFRELIKFKNTLNTEIKKAHINQAREKSVNFDPPFEVSRPCFGFDNNGNPFKADCFAHLKIFKVMKKQDTGISNSKPFVREFQLENMNENKLKCVHVSEYRKKLEQMPPGFARDNKLNELNKWNTNLKQNPKETNCIYCNGYSQDLAVCAADTNYNQTSDNNVIKSFVDWFKRHTEPFIQSVKMSKAITELTLQSKIPANESICEDNVYWKLMRKKIEKVADDALNDCLNLLTYGKENKESVTNYCIHFIIDSRSSFEELVLDKDGALLPNYTECVKKRMSCIYNDERIRAKIQSVVDKSSQGNKMSDLTSFDCKEDQLPNSGNQEEVNEPNQTQGNGQSNQNQSQSFLK